MTTLAILADCHLPDTDETVKEQVVDWALEEMVSRKVDLIIAVGDLTSTGTLRAAARVREKLNATRIPLLIVPGNAEYRSPDQSPEVLRILRTPPTVTCPGVTVIGLDNAAGRLTAESREFLRHWEAGERRPTLVAVHLPVEDMVAEDRCLIEQLIRGNRIDGWVCGHSHRDRTYPIGGCTCHEVRGLDPDKALGGPPAFTVLKSNAVTQAWSREDISYPYAHPEAWSKAEKAEFLSLLGISCMGDTLAGLELAAQQGIACVEVRFEPTRILAEKRLLAALEHWRQHGGAYLSLHFPDLKWDPEKRAVTGMTELDEACRLAAGLGVNAITWHVPRVSVFDIQDSGPALKPSLEAARKIMRQLKETGCRVAIENLHMNPGETAGVGRGFGYTPAECLFWIEQLRRVTGSDRIGFLLDVGHARNNAPYSSEFNLSQWYADMGRVTVGYHLHQVTQPAGGRMKNHGPITGLFGPLISFASFFMAWHGRQINHVPLFLEIRNEPFVPTLECLRQFVRDDNGKPQRAAHNGPQSNLDAQPSPP